MDPELIELGQKLLAFAHEKHTNLRTVRDGRQSLLRFAEQYPPKEVQFPATWTIHPKIANSALRRWMEAPSNPFATSEEGEIAEETDDEDTNDGIEVLGTAAPNTPVGTRPSGRADFPGAPERPRSLRNPEQNTSQVISYIKRLVREVTDIKASNHSIAEQNNEILIQNDEIKVEFERIRAQNKELKTQNEKLQQELEALRANTQDTPTARSWANVAAQGNRLRVTSNAESQDHLRTTRVERQSRMPGIEVDLSELSNPQFDISSIKEIRERALLAFKSHPMTEGIRWAGIERKTSDQTRIRICMHTKEEAETARIHNEWLGSHFQGARLLGDRWHPIKIDRVNKGGICDDTNMRLNSDACAKIGEENGTTVKRIRFLGQPNPDKTYCSIIAHLSTKEEVERMLEQQYMEVDGEMAYPKMFQHIPIPTRCYKCHKFANHVARRCPVTEPPCGRCAETGHAEVDCSAASPKCVNCEGPHHASDRGCPEYRRQRSALN